MKRFLILALTAALLAPIQASAHQPVPLLASDTSANNGPLLTDGTVSFAIRATFEKSKERRGFRANFKSGDELAIQYLILDKRPENALKKSKLPKLVATSPTGKKIKMKLNERTKFFEPYGGTDYLYLGRYDAPAEPGTYSFLITSRGKSAITIAIGEKEIMGEVVRGNAPAATPTPAGFTIAQVAANNERSSCWSAIDGSVYDLTAWINSHPGGAGAILSLCGVDGTNYFKSQHGSQSRPNQRLASFLLGPLTN